LEQLSRASDLIEGAQETIRALRAHYQMAIITNGLSDVQRPRLDASGIADCFALLAISEELGVVKPDPRFFEIVMQRIGQPPKAEVLVIGDSLTSDIQGGNNAGFDTCWYNPTGSAPDPRFPATYEIRILTDLHDLLDF
jgi:putative hydrolase of the HAD superfamily